MKTSILALTLMTMTTAAHAAPAFRSSVGKFVMSQEPATCTIVAYNPPQDSVPIVGADGKARPVSVQSFEEHKRKGEPCMPGEGYSYDYGNGSKDVVTNFKPGAKRLEKIRVENPSDNAKACLARQIDEARKAYAGAKDSASILDVRTIDVRLTDNTGAAVEDKNLSPRMVYQPQAKRLLVRATLTSTNACRIQAAENVVAKLEDHAMEALTEEAPAATVEKAIAPAKEEEKPAPKVIEAQVKQTDELDDLLERATAPRKPVAVAKAQPTKPSPEPTKVVDAPREELKPVKQMEDDEIPPGLGIPAHKGHRQAQ